MNLFDWLMVAAAAMFLLLGVLLRLMSPPAWVRSARARLRRHRDTYLVVLALTAAAAFGVLAFVSAVTTNPVWWFTPALIAVAGIALAAKLQQQGGER
jgi:peptidoglycan/LPS O-acetylase OafA/YrhL